jgi:pimeloyl-ACP methyl ester carboxylesterase
MAQRSRLAKALVPSVGAAVALLVSAPPPTSVAARAPVLDFESCGAESKEGFQCATARRVPLDYDRPRGRRIELAVIRHRATDPDRRLGTLFFNPGGPGAPGTHFLPSLYDDFPAELRARFDITSWDPRAVGSSTAVQCFANERAEARFLARIPVGFPVGGAERQAWTRGNAGLSRRCERRNGRLLEHVSTADTARDLDLLRRAVGDRRLNYYGASYGTFLGATYANLFPRRVGRMVLDANLDPVAYTRKGVRPPFLSTWLRTRTDEGAAETLRAFLDLCGRAATADCAFSAGSPEATQAKWSTLLARLRSQPVRLDAGSEPTTYAALVFQVIAGLYRVDPGWTTTAELIQSAWAASEASARASTPGPTASPMRRPGDRRVWARAAEQKYLGAEQQRAIMCAESPNPRRPRAYRRLDDLAFARAGEAGRFFSWFSQPCASWPARAADRYAGPWDRHTAHPVLVMGTTVDPATPYRGSVAMARHLARARLLTVEGYGHAVLLNPSSCSNDYVSGYVIKGALPPKGASCSQDRQPFAPAP